jgi:hypothetical protein
MKMTYNITIMDANHKHVGDLMTATQSDIINLLNKGMIVINQMDGSEITKETLMDTVGVSDGLIEM